MNRGITVTVTVLTAGSRHRRLGKYLGLTREEQVAEINDVHHVVESSINAVGILFNIILLYIIRRYSSSMVPTYKLLLTVDASLDLVLATSAFLGQPVYLIGENYFVSVARGPLPVFYRPLSAYLLILFCLIFLLNLIWIPAQFVCRCIIICYPQRKNVLFPLVAIAVVIWSVYGLVSVSPVYLPPPEFQAIGAEVLQKIGWPTEPVGTPVLGARLDEPRQLAYVLMWVISNALGISIVLASELKIMRFLRALNDAYTEQTRQMHKEFHRALLAMAICPLVATTIPVVYFATCMVFSLNPGMVSVFVSPAFASISVMNPLTTMLFMRSYRDVVLKALCGRVVKQRVAPSSVYDATTTVPNAAED